MCAVRLSKYCCGVSKGLRVVIKLAEKRGCR